MRLYAKFQFKRGKLKGYICNISLPKRATKGSAGYDFFAPFDFSLNAGETILIPTGIRAEITDGWFLALFPRSGLGFKYRLQLDNTVGIIDSDYFYAENEGHIMIKITNDSKGEKLLEVNAGKDLPKEFSFLTEFAPMMRQME